MAGMLMRSKSLKFLKGSRKDAHQQENENSMQPLKGSQTDFDKFQSATPISRAERTLETPDIATRPNTSGGPGDRTAMFHKKPSFAPSVHSQDHPLAFPSPTKSTTVLYTAEVTEEQGVIGIALGSPTLGSHWNTTPPVTSFNTGPQVSDSHMAAFYHSNGSSPSVVGRHQTPKPKVSRWKSLFRKAAPPPPKQENPSFYQLAQTVAAAPRADSHHDEEIPNSQIPPKQEKGRARTVSPPTYKPNIRASRKGVPEDFILPRSPLEAPITRGRESTLGNIGRASTTPNLPSRTMPYEHPAVPKVVISSSTGNTSVAAPEGGPLLDISIPDIKMERYSVMFGNLLQSGPNRSPSLLARRQGNADKLKPLNALSVKEGQQESPMGYKRHRRATSPTVPSPSPRLSLFPSTNPGRAPSPRSASVPRTRKLHRAQTAPAESPVRQTFSQLPEGTPKRFDSATLKPAASPYLKSALTPTSAHSFESDAESITIVAGQASPGHSRPFTVRLDEREPEWEILPKPLPVSKATPVTSAASPLSRTDSQKQPRVTKLSALCSHPSSAPLDAPSPLQRLQSLSSPPLSANRAGEKRTGSESRNRKVGEVPATALVGIARSVSVSRANSPRAAVIRTMTDIPRVGSPDRYVDRPVLTPTMVEVVNRRSQRVQLEEA